jgi:S-adenosylmethionine:tRNA ribosyltransferase-isomerase
MIHQPVDPELRLSDFDYDLPQELIAQEPPPERDGGRLLLVDRSSGQLSDLTVRHLPSLLSPQDVVVVNNTRVLPARLRGQRVTGGAAEVLLLDRVEPGVWNALVRPSRKLPPGATIFVPAHREGEGPLPLVLLDHLGEGRARISLPVEAEDKLERYGETPLPPYIHAKLDDPERYQTVFSREPGSAAAPTAGLHLSEAILGQLATQGTRLTEVTLQVGLDTFRPVTVERVADHEIHREWCSVSSVSARLITSAKASGGRVIAIGTTSARTLESWGQLPGSERADGWAGWTGIFITPGYEWTTVDALLTNFHLPKSTLLMMIQSFAGRALAMAAYEHAIQERYRFFSFGDAMIIV